MPAANAANSDPDNTAGDAGPPPLATEPDVKVEVAMGIRRPPSDVLSALVDPAQTTRFWFTKSSGRVEAGARLRWDWEMYGASADVSVRDVQPDKIVFDWGAADGPTRTVDVRLRPWGTDGTYVTVVESGFAGDVTETMSWLADSTGGFTQLLAAMKAYLEHDITLTLVLDQHPADL